MKSEYINAVEQRLHWLKWSEGAGESTWRRLGYAQAMPFYHDMLERADTFYMAPHFSRLVDHARQQTPDELKFDMTWLQSPCGFLWLDEPFLCPSIVPEEPVRKAMDDVNAELDQLQVALEDRTVDRAEIKARLERLEHDFRINGRKLDLLKGIEQDWKRALDHLTDTVHKAQHGEASLAEQGAALAAVKASAAKWPGIDIHVRAVGWRVTPAGTMVYNEWGGEAERTTVKSVYVGCFQSFADYNEDAPGFGCWSYFTIKDGEPLGPRVVRFEDRQVTGRYADPPAGIDADQVPAWRYNQDPAHRRDRRQHPLHEIRWVYTAMYLMARRLAITVQHATDRATQRRAQRGGQEAPPFIRVITLRRLEAAREREAPNVVDWQWQWEVRGHWRNQFFPSEGLHKPVFIEAFIKGPSDKPLKPGVLKLFAAER